MFKPNEIERLSMALDEPMKQLEMRIMSDVVRRIRINGEITRSADWQLNRLRQLGVSEQEIRTMLQESLHISDEDMNKLYTGIIKAGYARDESLYEEVGKVFIPFEDNVGLQQLISAVADQTSSELTNITQSLGFAVRQPSGKLAFTPLASYYQQTLDGAMFDIASGAFDYNTVLKRVVKEMTNSGLRTVDYASGHSNRVDVAARRAVMTGLSQLTSKVNEDNAAALETDTYEISWHTGARPSHWWGGRWYKKDELVSICGLGDVTGLCGANCYHDYYPVVPGVSEPTYSKDELDELNRKEQEKVSFGGKEYNKYEATQRQRKLETTMRAQREEIKLLKEGGASEDDLIAARARYRATSAEYSRFSAAMDLPQQRERVNIDGLGNIGQGKYTGGSNKPSPIFVSPVGAKANRNDIGAVINAPAKNEFMTPITTIEQANDYLNSVFGSVEKNVTALDKQLVIDNAEQLRKLNAKFGVLTEENMGYVSGSRMKAVASTSWGVKRENTHDLTLYSKYYTSRDTLIQAEKRARDGFWIMPFTDDYVTTYSVTHEYGHMLALDIMKSRIEPSWYEEFKSVRAQKFTSTALAMEKRELKKQSKNLWDEIVGIARENNPDFKVSKKTLSQYGFTNTDEAFAETFANSQCGSPNELGKAMLVFLKRSGY